MKTSYLFIVAVLLCQLSIGQDITETGSDVTVEEATEFLKHHNMARSEVGVSNLSWNASIAKVAQEFANFLAADNCSFKHSGNENYGENVFMGNGTVYTALDASKSWYSELADYTYSDTDYNHYTQMVWKKTTEVGVGVGVCEDGSYIIVANYAPSGNMYGTFPY
ncbi:CAP domain-containing protein [Ulvibacter litoralis]|uniref:Pathogenesis-related protein 1 n=1 Tax=Ulvibacter litoralis TaxID=227084 RepID=A0A1G7HH75_9FLAO|nr:CAP domain-containing protein [Ulvibacter litoralis]GHC57806.1 hypothetical protein GCM10008083_23040 [Ulvibacter litoralis]SDE99840.1 pathogenesis-related protein 1 [Ulvibacter litoralis]